MAAENNNKHECSSCPAIGRMSSTPFACIAVQMALKAAIELNVFDILADYQQLSAPQIASKIHNPNPSPKQSVTALYRILRFLSSNSFLTTSLPPGFTVEERDRLFGITPLTAATMARANVDDALPMTATFILFLSQREIVQSYDMLKYTVQGLTTASSTSPFQMAHGVGFYDYMAERPDSQLNATFNRSMGGSTKYIFDNLINVYNGFGEVVQLTDVGGNHGSTLEHLISVYPNIQGCINFDLPHVIAQAPPLKGVKHVAGDMFEALPDSKAIMLKWILHNWSDDECVKLLQNCWRALPEEGGKVIVVELVIPEDLERSPDAIGVTSMDLCMLALCQGGRERTVTEFRYLASSSGFSHVNVVPVGNGFHVLEFLKQTST